MEKMKKEFDPKQKTKNVKKNQTNKKSEKPKQKPKQKKKRVGGVNFLGIYLNEINPLIYISIFAILLAFPLLNLIY